MKILYTDGSYARGRYGYGFILVESPSVGAKFELIYKEGGECPAPFNVSNNIGPEICAVVKGLNYCRKHGVMVVTIAHDYNGLGHWARGEWKANNDLTKRYKAFIQKLDDMTLTFFKVDGHTGMEGNDLVDGLATGIIVEVPTTTTSTLSITDTYQMFKNYLADEGYSCIVVTKNSQVVRFSIHQRDGGSLGYGNIYATNSGPQFRGHQVTDNVITECWNDFSNQL